MHFVIAVYQKKGRCEKEGTYTYFFDYGIMKCRKRNYAHYTFK